MIEFIHSYLESIFPVTFENTIPRHSASNEHSLLVLPYDKLRLRIHVKIIQKLALMVTYKFPEGDMGSGKVSDLV